MCITLLAYVIRVGVSREVAETLISCQLFTYVQLLKKIKLHWKKENLRFLMGDKNKI